MYALYSSLKGDEQRKTNEKDGKWRTQRTLEGGSEGGVEKFTCMMRFLLEKNEKTS
jgi:hypothetical protein